MPLTPSDADWGAEQVGLVRLRMDDHSTIMREAASAYDRAWSLIEVAIELRRYGHDPVALRRDDADRAWEILVRPPPEAAQPPGG